MKTLSFLIAGLLLTAAIAAAAPPADSTTDAAAAFARLKTLAGDWEATTSMGKAHVKYEVISGGNTVAEHEFIGNEGEMLTVYYLDGNRLLLTHYCSAGNQPRMQATAFDPQTGELRFQFLDATNLAGPGAGHMHNVTLHFVDKDHLSAEWQFFENGQQKLSEKAQYTRTR
jgi:hypothetical protein